MTIAVDFDGTIVEHEYPKIGKPIPYAFEVLRKLLLEENHKLILWTMREGQLLDEAVEYCEKNGIYFYACNKNYPEEKVEDGCPRKLGADLFIDDRNVGGMLDWGTIYKMITNRYYLAQHIDNQFNDVRVTEYGNWFTRMREEWQKAKKRR
ncbi:MAG: hypothetical protein LBE56_07950 [Tannerella sp.]|jgi:hypothetical protein|nr:hypothetical protein [Tannerella sp.]